MEYAKKKRNYLMKYKTIERQDVKNLTKKLYPDNDYFIALDGNGFKICEKVKEIYWPEFVYCHKVKTQTNSLCSTRTVCKIYSRWNVYESPIMKRWTFYSSKGRILRKLRQILEIYDNRTYINYLKDKYIAKKV